MVNEVREPPAPDVGAHWQVGPGRGSDTLRRQRGDFDGHSLQRAADQLIVDRNQRCPGRVRARLTAGALVVVLGGGLFSCARRSPDVSPPPPAPAPAASTQPEPRAPDEGAAPCPRDAEAEKIVAAELVRRIQPAQAQPRAHVRVTFGCLPASTNGPLQIDGFRAHGHGGNAVLISLDLAQDGTCAVRTVHLTPDRAPSLAGPPPALAITRAHVPEARARHALSLMR